MPKLKPSKNIDWILIAILLALVVFGNIAIYSASVHKFGDRIEVSDYYVKQMIWMVIAIILFFIIIYMPDILLEIIAFPGYVFSILLLILVLFLPAADGVHRWIRIGGMNFQPSEIAKIFVILFAAKIMTKENISKLTKFLLSFIIILIPTLLVLKEPDLGGSLVFLVLLLPMLYFANISLVTIFIIISPLLSIIVGFSPILWIIFDLLLILILVLNKINLLQGGIVVSINAFISFLAPYFWSTLRGYQQERILTFLNPARDMLGSGYQIIQAKIAVGSGKIFGKGLLEGTQKNMEFLPAQHTDFIFSVIGEELGFVGCLVLIILFILLFYRIVVILKKTRVNSNKVIMVGILTYLVFQVFVNIGMNIGIIPVAGIPLPFISYGGSNLIVNTVAIALIAKFEKERSFIYS